MSENCPFDVTPYKNAKDDRNSVIYNLNYTSQDYWSLKSRMLEMIKEKFSNDFNDITEASLGLMIVELYAFVADLLSFKIDQIANEVYIDSVTELENAFRISKLVGFKPLPPVPARTMLVAKINNPYSHDIIIKTPILLGYNLGSANNDFTFEAYAADSNGNPIFNEDIIILSGQLSNRSIVAIEGRTFTSNFESTGEPWQQHEISRDSVLFNSIRIIVDGQHWDKVEYFSNSPKPEFRIEYKYDYKPTILLGDGLTGLVPMKGSKVFVSYRTGTGSNGNIITGAIDQNVHVNVDGLDFPVIVNFNNYTKGLYGYGGDTIEDIRRKLPTYLKTQDRAVTGADYKAIIEQFSTQNNGTVGKATVSLRNHGCSGNIIDVHILARNNNELVEPNENLKNELIQELETKKMFTDFICIKSGTISLVDVHIDIFLDRSLKKYEDSIKEKTDRRIKHFFSIYNWEFGQTLREADIIKILADIKEIKRIELNFTTAKNLESGDGHSQTITAHHNEIIRPDNINIAFNYQNIGET
jgi:hypothetical protein